MSAERAGRELVEDAGVWRIAGRHDVALLTAHYVHQAFPRHSHESFVFCVNEAGAHASWYAGANEIIPAGAICIVPPGEVHTGSAVPGHPWHYRAVYPDAAMVASLTCALGWRSTTAPTFPALFVQDWELASRFVRAHRRCEATQDPLEQEGLIADALMAVLERHATPAQKIDETPSGGGINRAVEYIHACVGDRITLDALAEAAGLSRYGVLRAFRRRVGIPPYAYVTQIRIEHARRLLLRGIPIATVSLCVGFADQSHLNRHFKRLVGVTPGAFVRGARAA